jgi:hypothetical protein
MRIEPRTFGLLLQRLTETKPPIKIDSRAWVGGMYTLRRIVDNVVIASQRCIARLETRKLSLDLEA